MPPFFAIHNIIPFFVFIAVVTFLLNYQSDTASSVTEFDRNILFARFIVFGLFAALVVRWRIYKAMPILVLGSHPHSSAYRMLVQSRELGRGDGGHKCGPPERRYPVAYRLFDERKIDSQQKQREGEAVIPPVAVYFPCRYGGASDDSNSREKIESINKKLFNCTMPWLPRNDIQSVAGISVRQNTPEFALYHWCDVKVRAKNVTPSSSSSSSMDINEKVKPISTIEDILCSEECPIILFSHGNCTNCNFYSDFCVELASRGAVVVVPWYMDGSSSGCLISDTSLQRELPKYESSPLKSKIVTSAKNTNVKNLFIHYIDTGGISDETNSFVVSIRQEQLDERVKETENVANKLLANGMLFGRDMLGWFDDELKLRQCINRIRSSHGVSLMGHSFGGSTIFAVMANRLTLGDFSSSSCCKFRNYTCYDLWSLPIKKHLEKVENFLKIQEISKLSTRNKKKQNDDDDGDEHIADSTSTPLPFLELQTSDEWSTFKDTHMAVIERIRSCWDPQRYRFRIRRGTDHLSLCDAGMLTPRYFRHRDSKRRGLWTDDAIFICDSAIEAFETMKLH